MYNVYYNNEMVFFVLLQGTISVLNFMLSYSRSDLLVLNIHEEKRLHFIISLEIVIKNILL